MSPSRFDRARFLAAEFVVIVVGVLVALGVDQLMAERADRRAESGYTGRLMTNLASDTAQFAWFRGALGIKAEVLHGLARRDPRLLSVEDPPAVMGGLTYSTFVGLTEVDASTFEELQSSGDLRLLGDSELRSQLTHYYASYRRMTEILDSRFGPYRELVFGTIPGELQYRTRRDSLAVDAHQLCSDLTALTSHPDLEAAVNAELAYTAALLFYVNEADARTRTLLTGLATRYPD